MKDNISPSEVKSDNEIIAEFMGYTFQKDNTTHPNGWYICERYAEDRFPEDPIPFGYCHYKEDFVSFSTSWDWLMPAFGKFASLDLETNDYVHHVVAISEKILECDIQGACERLVEGIKWYNSQNQ